MESSGEKGLLISLGVMESEVPAPDHPCKMLHEEGEGALDPSEWKGTKHTHISVAHVHCLFRQRVDVLCYTEFGFLFYSSQRNERNDKSGGRRKPHQSTNINTF